MSGDGLLMDNGYQCFILPRQVWYQFTDSLWMNDFVSLERTRTEDFESGVHVTADASSDCAAMRTSSKLDYTKVSVTSSKN